MSLQGTVAAPLYQFDGQQGQWLNPQDAPAPLAEVISQSFIYTTAKANLAASNFEGNLAQFAQQLDQFALDSNDFYSRDEGVNGLLNRKATDSSIGNSAIISSMMLPSV